MLLKLSAEIGELLLTGNTTEIEYPYLENGTELLVTYRWLTALEPNTPLSSATQPTQPSNQYGICRRNILRRLQRFWNTLHNNPASLGSNKAEAAYIVPKDYGFGFRSPNDTIWGLKPADDLSQKIYDDTNNILPSIYGSRFDVLYDEPEIIAPLLKNYTAVYYWNQTIP